MWNKVILASRTTPKRILQNGLELLVVVESATLSTYLKILLILSLQPGFARLARTLSLTLYLSKSFIFLDFTLFFEDQFFHFPLHNEKTKQICGESYPTMVACVKVRACLWFVGRAYKNLKTFWKVGTHAIMLIYTNTCNYVCNTGW